MRKIVLFSELKAYVKEQLESATHLPELLRNLQTCVALVRQYAKQGEVEVE